MVNFFSSVFTQENYDGPDINIESNSVPLMPKLNFSIADIENKLIKLKLDKAPGADDLHPRILFELRSVIPYPLKLIFETSLKSGKLPEIWKTGIVTAFFKTGSKSDIGNYRPISLTSVVCKIFESLIRDHIMQHLLTNNMMSSKQYGFMKGRSTSLQLLHTLDKCNLYCF